VVFRQLDVERDLPAALGERYDAACCLEVIEHTENPWALLRSLHALLEPAGYLLLSTPNITSFLSRIVFLRTGRFHQFGDGDVAYGHVNPLTSHEIRLIASQVGFTVRDLRPAGTLPLLDLSNPHPRQLILNLARVLLYPLMAGDKHGWCVLALLQKDDGAPASTEVS
jgi:hypothetical protein